MTGIPSQNYESRIPIFESICSGSLDDCIVETGFTGHRIVTNVPENELDPYYASPYAGRAKNSNEFSIYLGDSFETCSAELFGNSDLSGIPKDSWGLKYDYYGRVLNIGLVENSDFKNQFLESSGDARREFSQDFKCYLVEKGLTSCCDSIGWPSVSGTKIGCPGQVYAWHSGESGQFSFIEKCRLA